MAIELGSATGPASPDAQPARGPHSGGQPAVLGRLTPPMAG